MDGLMHNALFALHQQLLNCPCQKKAMELNSPQIALDCPDCMSLLRSIAELEKRPAWLTISEAIENTLVQTNL
jgi:hypothetical protein